jgi:hypothetical protein
MMTAGFEWPRIAALTKHCALADCHGESASSASAVIFSAGVLLQMLLNRLLIFLLGMKEPVSCEQSLFCTEG